MKSSWILLGMLLSIGMAAIVNSYIDEEGRPIDHHVGSYMVKDEQGTLYKVTYDVESLGGNLIINMDMQRGINNVQCDSDNVELLITFVNNNYAQGFYKVINSGSMTRFVTGTKWDCHDLQTGEMLLMRRVLSAELNRNQVLLHTAQGHYEESIKEGVITLDKAEEPQEHSKTFCLGVNSNQDCSSAKGPISLYENKYISFTCSNCFIGAKATVFLDVKISWFKLRRIAAGLKDISVNGAFVLDMEANGAWSAGVDKIYKIVDNAKIIQFWIGPIPIVISYDIPVQVLATAQLNVHAHAEAGVKAKWSIGNAYVEWNEHKGWHMEKPHPQFAWEHVLGGEANFQAAAGLSIIPSFIIRCNRIMQAGVKLEPSISLKAEGDVNKKELCVDANYHIKSEASAEVHINIPYVRIRYDKIFGPYSLFDTGVKPIGHWCVKGK